MVTGASGFLGSELVDGLRRTENYKIYTTDKVGNNDFNGDLSDWDFVKKFKCFDIVIHCAGVQYVNKDKPIFFRKSWFYKNNVKTIKNLVRVFNKKNTYFVNVGTSMQYKLDNSLSYNTKSLMDDQGVYSWSKIAAHKVLLDSKLKFVTIIPCIIGGEGREGLFKDFINSIYNWHIAFIPGKGSSPLSIVHVKDVVKLIKIVLNKKPKGIFNVASNEALTITEWTEIIKDTLLISKIKKFYIPLSALRILSKLFLHRLLAKEQLLLLEMPHFLCTKSSKKIGWKPLYNSKKTIQSITLHYKSKFERQK